jgi:hypothetical protein
VGHRIDKSIRSGLLPTIALPTIYSERDELVEPFPSPNAKGLGLDWQRGKQRGLAEPEVLAGAVAVTKGDSRPLPDKVHSTSGGTQRTRRRLRREPDHFNQSGFARRTPGF